jgi:aconitate hydratase
MSVAIESTPSFIEAVYAKMEANIKTVRSRLNRPLTYAEKILFGHLDDAAGANLEPGKAYIKTRPDRIALQDATAQMAILQFMLADKSEAAVPVTVHCDHLIRGHKGADNDLKIANNENKEVYDFLSSSSQKYGFGFWKPGAGIIHQVVLEQYAFPGLMMLGTDSHTPNAGGLGGFASGVGGADAVDVMVGLPWEVLQPHVVGVKLTGSMSSWTAPKDVILKLLDILTCSGGTNRVIEYFGEGTESISCTGKATICNMGAELGATTSTFPFDARMATYLKAIGRPETAELAAKYADMLTADPECLENPEQYYDTVVEINLSELEPYLVGPHSPDLASPVSKMDQHMAKGGWPTKISAALIGSCTNSSYEDMGRIADMAEQLLTKGTKLKMPLFISPGSEQVRATIDRDGQLGKLEQLGAVILTNACGPCIGQWQRDDTKTGTSNSIVTSYNRNFPKRADGNPETCAFIGSPETAFAYACTGDLSSDPFTTELTAEDSTSFTLVPPENIAEIPADGFIRDEHGYLAPPADRSGIEVMVSPDSKRLALLTPFSSWDGKNYTGLQLLIKAKGKCTTDHISPAGPWLKFRGHLNNISDNMLTGAVNAFNDAVGQATNALNGKLEPVTDIARAYLADGQHWAVIGDTNYGEGSSREHAAMSPRHMGGQVVITRSFARIHETNLKKQGVLPLTFDNKSDYDLVQEGDLLDIIGLPEIAPKSAIKMVLHHKDGSTDEISLNHTLNAEQIDWFKAGSALNFLRQ